jgi:hypothetical protein
LAPFTSSGVADGQRPALPCVQSTSTPWSASRSAFAQEGGVAVAGKSPPAIGRRSGAAPSSRIGSPPQRRSTSPHPRALTTTTCASRHSRAKAGLEFHAVDPPGSAGHRHRRRSGDVGHMNESNAAGFHGESREATVQVSSATGLEPCSAHRCSGRRAQLTACRGGARRIDPITYARGSRVAALVSSSTGLPRRMVRPWNVAPASVALILRRRLPGHLLHRAGPQDWSARTTAS